MCILMDCNQFGTGQTGLRSLREKIPRLWSLDWPPVDSSNNDSTYTRPDVGHGTR